MAIHTKIQWTDSSLNLAIGCDGCELWNEKTGVRKCYAGVLTGRHAGKKGWPDSFDKPKLFPERLQAARRWPDLTGKVRPDKPWMDLLPRTIFVDDMGDTFTESLPIDWLLPHMAVLSGWPHINIMLTKRPHRMRQFFTIAGGVPENFWLCTTITTQASCSRITRLAEIDAPVLGLSIEPLWERIDFRHVPGVERVRWVKIGGESGANATPCELDWIREARDFFRGQGTAVFIKQFGTKVLEGGKSVRLKDYHGGDWDEWADEFCVREMPVSADQYAATA